MFFNSDNSTYVQFLEILQRRFLKDHTITEPLIHVRLDFEDNSAIIKSYVSTKPCCELSRRDDSNEGLQNTVDSRYLEITSRYPYFDISDL